jgi:hypothetical protein
MSKSMRNMGTEAGFSHLVGAEVPFSHYRVGGLDDRLPAIADPDTAQRRQFRVIQGDLFDNN